MIETARIQELAEPILAEQGLELVELTCHPQSGQVAVRLLVDRVGGVTIQHCARANQRIGQALLEAAGETANYVVEVSSPGLDRPLVSHRDFERAIGETLVVTARTAEAGRFKDWQGMLLAVQHEAIVLTTNRGNVTVPLTDIQTAKKALRW